MEINYFQGFCKSKEPKIDSFQFKIPLIEAFQCFSQADELTHNPHTKNIQDIINLLETVINGGGEYQGSITNNNGEVVITRNETELTNTKTNHLLKEYCQSIKGFCVSIENIKTQLSNQSQSYLTFTITSKLKPAEQYFEGILNYTNGLNTCLDDIKILIFEIGLFSIKHLEKVHQLIENAIIQDCDLTYDFIAKKGHFEEVLTILHKSCKPEYKDFCHITKEKERFQRLELKLGIRKGNQFKWLYCQLYSKSLDILFHDKHKEYYTPLKTIVKQAYNENNLEICRMEVNLKSLSFLNKNAKEIIKGIGFDKPKGSLSFKDIEKFQKMIQTVMGITLNEYIETNGMIDTKIDTYTKEYSKKSQLKPVEYELIKQTFQNTINQYKEVEVWNDILIKEIFEKEIYQKTLLTNTASYFKHAQGKSEAIKRYKKLKEDIFNFWKGLFIAQEIYTENNNDKRCQNIKLHSNPFELIKSIMI